MTITGFARLVETGPDLSKAAGAAILMHGRGGSAEDMAGLAEAFAVSGVRYFLPEAEGSTWYPYRFIEPIERNEPYLTSALTSYRGLIDRIRAAGTAPERIFIGGFSQGACLTAEFAARNPMRYGGIALFTGGLIGPPGQVWPVREGMTGTPVFLAASAHDAHVPAGRVRETAALFTAMGAEVDLRIYPGSTHMITEVELAAARQVMQRMVA